ncbi:type II toxin-antitoxin system HicA family toxin [Lentisphaerota bacterium ZTH]|nr:type II toxin-antitoxin system HicA family toxin [Lentisphaerota bacterium]WET05531.1 type II toxin-antitoxin system HicA family toxin [Lentisphaerota bacterium ZTH]
MASSLQIMKMLKKDGWYVARTRGDHYQFKHPEKRGLVTLQHPVKDLRKDVLSSIYKQAGWK